MPNVLALDPGAERLGYVVLEEREGELPLSRASGMVGVKRGADEEYQTYRLRIIDYFIGKADELIRTHNPVVIVNEIIPPVGGNASNQIQRQLALTALTAFQTVGRQSKIELKQIAASTIKAKIGGNRKATKTTVRNNVFVIMPETLIFKKQWVGVYDESDAYAVGLTYLGYNVKEQRTAAKGTPAS